MTSTTRATIARIGSAPTTTTTFVGDLVSPTMSTAAGFSRDAVTRAFESVDLFPDFDATDRASFGRAYADARQRQHVAAISPALSWEREERRGEALLLRWSDGRGKAKTTRTVARVTLRPRNGIGSYDPVLLEHGERWAIMGTEERNKALAALDQFRELFAWHEAHVASSDVRHQIEYRLHLVGSVKISSSLWFVPADGHSMAERLEQAVASSGVGDLAVFPQFDSALGTARTGRMVRASILDEVAEVKAQLAQLIERDARDSAIEARVARLRELRDRGEACIAVLGAQVEDIKRAVADALAISITGDDDGADLP